MKNETCFICNRVGHIAKVCFDNVHNRNQANHQGNNRYSNQLNRNETIDFIGSINVIKNNELTWLGDTGASVHVTDDMNDLIQVTNANTMLVLVVT